MGVRGGVEPGKGHERDDEERAPEGERQMEPKKPVSPVTPGATERRLRRSGGLNLLVDRTHPSSLP
jgi:hypothetical protein